MEARAIARYVRVSPRKARVVVDLVRGKSVLQAREVLAFTNRGIAECVEKTLNSAVANAEHLHHVRPESLVVKEAYVDEGPTLKRIRPRAKGSASRIRKRSSHITIVVGTREEA
ncbi:50S ribosomal protein L22 [Gordonibacter sp. Marseille-P4307]|uniref:50S ribosomal protein L22 n=1 Tax=Gordonibacter sp. Marseille-P4307 TaxID=2161815 RepID=UPI000F526737|nr:50S ribosomal protein L22 [Gordonibacter sp. Marseille-P4307]